MMLIMGWQDLFTSRRHKHLSAVLATVAKANEQQAAATNRLADTIERVIDAKTGRNRNDREISELPSN